MRIELCFFHDVVHFSKNDMEDAASYFQGLPEFCNGCANIQICAQIASFEVTYQIPFVLSTAELPLTSAEVFFLAHSSIIKVLRISQKFVGPLLVVSQSVFTHHRLIHVTVDTFFFLVHFDSNLLDFFEHHTRIR